MLLVFCCTILGAAAQILMKIGLTHCTPEPVAMATNLPLMGGYVLYGLSTLLLVLALQRASFRCSTP